METLDHAIEQAIKLGYHLDSLLWQRASYRRRSCVSQVRLMIYCGCSTPRLHRSRDTSTQPG